MAATGSSGSPNARRERRRLDLPEPPPPDEDQTGWLLTFSDLVLQLFAFVMVAVVLGNARQTVRPTPAEASPAPPPAAEANAAPPTAVEAVTVIAAEAVPPTAAPEAPSEEPPPAPTPDVPPDALRDRIASALPVDGVSVTARDSDVVLSLSDRITFASGSADLLPTARPLLARIGALAAALPDRTIEVAGHTDDVPIHTAAFPSNLELSLARAARVVRELRSASPELAGRMIATGFGEQRPVVPNDDVEGRAQNRRVEIRFVAERPATS